jgi:hypothetical protein
MSLHTPPYVGCAHPFDLSPNPDTRRGPTPPPSTTSTTTSTPSKGGTSTPEATGGAHKFTRKGKWSAEEEVYTQRLIVHFEGGLLRLEEGTTLRSFLSERLHCDPMRITKKFQGESSIGKRSYSSSFPIEGKAPDYSTRVEKAEEELHELRACFLAKLRILDGKNCTLSGAKRSLPGRSRSWPVLSVVAVNMLASAFASTMPQKEAAQITVKPPSDNEFCCFLKKLQEQTQPSVDQARNASVEDKSFANLANQPQPSVLDFNDDGFAANLLVNFATVVRSNKKQRVDCPLNNSSIASSSRLCVTF